jgi:hypothetical protein
MKTSEAWFLVFEYTSRLQLRIFATAVLSLVITAFPVNLNNHYMAPDPVEVLGTWRSVGGK